MNNKFTNLFKTFSILTLTVLLTLPTFAGNKRVVVEDHTGAWCGWCPLGTQAIEDMEAKYGDDFIAIAVHNNDGMAVSSYQGPLAQAMGVTGYPSGTINRTQTIHPSSWDQEVGQLVGQQADVDVEVDWNLNESTGELTATVTATVNNQVNNQLSFNLWVIEDYVTGSGQGWDQANYLSGRSGYESHPYYSKSNPVTDYEHMNTFREAIGGLWGENGEFPASAAPGTYSHTFNTNVSSYAQNMGNIYVVAVVHNTSTREIMNGVQDGKKILTPATVTLNNDNPYTSTDADASASSTVKVTNDMDFEMTVDLAIDSERSLIPQGWDVSLANDQVTVPANGTVNVDVNMSPNNNAGFVSAVVTATPVNPGEEYRGVAREANVYSLSNSTESAVFFGYDDGIAPTLQSILASGELSNEGIIPASSDVIDNYPQLNTILKTAIYTVGDSQFGFTTAGTNKQLGLIKNLYNNGVDLLVAAPFDIINLGGVINGQSPTAEATAFFENDLGVEYGQFFQLVQNNQLYTLPVQGVSGDEISNGMSFNINQGYSQSYPYYSAYAASMKITGNSATHFLSVNTTEIPAANTRIAVRWDNNGDRMILTGMSLDAIGVSSTRNDLVQKMIEWLQGGEQSNDTPSISLSTQTLGFGSVMVGESKSMDIEISNTGAAALSLTGLNIPSNSGFMLTDNPQLPLTVDAGQKVLLSVSFMPTEDKSYMEEMTIVSNDPNNATSTVSLSGAGSVTSVTSNGIINGLFEMNVSPNPVVDASTVEFRLDGSNAKNVNIQLIDTRGQAVADILNKNVQPGDSNLELNAEGLPSGQYYLIADVDGERTQLPVLITK